MLFYDSSILICANNPLLSLFQLKQNNFIDHQSYDLGDGMSCTAISSLYSGNILLGVGGFCPQIIEIKIGFNKLNLKLIRSINIFSNEIDLIVEIQQNYIAIAGISFPQNIMNFNRNPENNKSDNNSQIEIGPLSFIDLSKSNPIQKTPNEDLKVDAEVGIRCKDMILMNQSQNDNHDHHNNVKRLIAVLNGVLLVIE